MAKLEVDQITFMKKTQALIKARGREPLLSRFESAADVLF